MKVLLVSTLERGGPVEQTLLLARELHELGVSVAVTTAGDAVADRFRQTGVNATPLPLRAGLDVAGAGRLWRLMRGADVVHAQDRRSGLWMRLAPGMGSVARVYTVHGLPDPYMPPPIGSERPGLRDRLAYEVVDAGLGRRADALIIPSRALADTFVARLRLPAERIAVVPNGVAAIARIDARGSEVGTLSLLDPVKDISTFLRAAALLRIDRRALRFVITGTGPEEEALRHQATALGLDDALEFAGFVPRNEALARLAVLVMPSIVENAPMALLEALSAGVPVVASETGGIPELVGDAGTATLVAPGDADGFAAAVAALLDDPARAQAQVDAGRVRVQQLYTARANAQATLAVYERALAGRRGGGSAAGEHEA